MKRKANSVTTNSRAQRPKYPEADYCDAIQWTDTNGNLVWPASAEALGIARNFLKEWYVSIGTIEVSAWGSH